MAEPRTTHLVDVTIRPDTDRRPVEVEPRSRPEVPLDDRPTAAQRTERGHLPARVLIMGWVVLLMLAVLVVVNLATRQSLLADVEDRAVTALRQENEELRQFAAVGVDPRTGQRFDDVRTLLRTHMQGQTPDEHEILFGYVDAARPGAPPEPAVRQFEQPLYDVSADPVLSGQILGSPAATGSVPTPAGELRWQKIRIERLPDAAGAAGGGFVTGRFIDADQAAVGETMQTLMLVSLAGLLLAGAGAWLVSGQILAPVRLVRQTAAEITERDLTRRIPVPGSDDISALAEQFNAMLDRLEAAFSAQRQFVDDASHELRTPITIVRGHLELMGDDQNERAAVVRLVLDELDRMSRIVEDLLILAKSQRPDFVRPEPVSIAELTSDIDAKVRALGHRRWVLEAMGEGTALLDPQRVTQALVQLAQNAVQHTKDGDEIRIGSAVREHAAGTGEGGFVALWVTDTGPGVRPEDANAIFERFTRGPASGARRHSGAGLGLAIVRAIANAHHGTVRLVSEPGRGATFGMELPADSATGTERSSW